MSDWGGPYVVVGAICGRVDRGELGYNILNVVHQLAVKGPGAKTEVTGTFAFVIVGGANASATRVEVTQTYARQSPVKIYDREIYLDGTGAQKLIELQVVFEPGYEGTMYFDIHLNGRIVMRTPFNLTQIYDDRGYIERDPVITGT